jgi:hypothetical protein
MSAMHSATWFRAGLPASARMRVDQQTRTPVGRRRNKGTSLAHTYRSDQWASLKATHNPTEVCAQDGERALPRVLDTFADDGATSVVDPLEVGFALFTTLFCSQNTVQLMTASMVINLTPGSDNPSRAYGQIRIDDSQYGPYKQTRHPGVSAPCL